MAGVIASAIVDRAGRGAIHSYHAGKCSVGYKFEVIVVVRRSEKCVRVKQANRGDGWGELWESVLLGFPTVGRRFSCWREEFSERFDGEFGQSKTAVA